MWPLDVGDLFMVGKSTASTLRSIGINTIGDLAVCKESFLRKYFKNQTTFLIESANGIDYSKVEPRSNKSDSISVSETLPYDVSDKDKIKEILFRQTEEVTRALRYQKQYAKTVAITYKNSMFQSYQHQTKLKAPENSTTAVYKVVIDILEESWKDEAIRNIGVRLADFTDNRVEQVDIFSEVKEEKQDKIEEIADSINKKYGGASVMPASIKVIGKMNRGKSHKN
jgi:DNA polymerase-4